MGGVITALRVQDTLTASAASDCQLRPWRLMSRNNTRGAGPCEDLGSPRLCQLRPWNGWVETTLRVQDPVRTSAACDCASCWHPHMQHCKLTVKQQKAFLSPSGCSSLRLECLKDWASSSGDSEGCIHPASPSWMPAALACGWNFPDSHHLLPQCLFLCSNFCLLCRHQLHWTKAHSHDLILTWSFIFSFIFQEIF